MLEQSDDGDMQYEDRQKEQINTSLMQYGSCMNT